MTKRFNYHIDEVGIYYYVCDNSKKGDDRIILEFDSKYDAMEVCEVLNELNEDFDDALNTISKMQEENQDLATKKEDSEYELLHLKEKYEELLEKNGELKNSNHRLSQHLIKHLDRIMQLEKEKEQLQAQIKIYEEFLKGNNLDIEWDSFCNADKCEYTDEEFEKGFDCKDCKYMRW